MPAAQVTPEDACPVTADHRRERTGGRAGTVGKCVGDFDTVQARLISSIDGQVLGGMISLFMHEISANS